MPATLRMAQEMGRGMGEREVLLEGLSKMTFTSLRYVAFDQLHEKYGVLRDASPQRDLVVMVESKAIMSSAKWHPERLYFYRSSARHFARRLEERGFVVEFIQSSSTVVGLTEIKAKYPGLPLLIAEQTSFKQRERLSALADEVRPSDFFLTPPPVFQEWAASQRTHLLENFYRQQRLRLNMLMDGTNPVGGVWNYDKENRLPPPKNHTWVSPLEHPLDDIDQEIATELKHTPSGAWATTREGAIDQLKHFLHFNFNDFGPYEDAMAPDSWAMNHSLLSPYLNVGLLHPSEVLEAAMMRFNKGDIALASAEGFIRQLIGWREYVNGMYWFQGPEYQSSNGLEASRPLLPLFDDAGATKMNCVGSIIRDIDARAWTHHIPRLMVLSNLALLTGTDPQEFLEWMRRRFIDAAEWVMVPNVIGMGVHADGGRMMTKPYAAGGAYISRMSDYCKDCPYNPKLRTGETACPFTTLYWDFLARHEAEFSGNHRMAQQLHGMRKLVDMPALKERAKVVLEGLSGGEV